MIRGKIILLGDSITQLSFGSPSGFGAYLAHIYQRRADVLNRGFSGYNTDWILQLLHTEDGLRDVFELQDENDNDEDCHDGSGNNFECNNVCESSTAPSSTNKSVRLVTIFFGANDATHPELNERQHVPLSRYSSNLVEIIQLVRDECPYAHIILITPPPVHHESRLLYQIKRYGKEGATGQLERTLELSGQYAHAAENVAKEMNVPCLNLWMEMQHYKREEIGSIDNIDKKENEWSELLSDGLHLSSLGNEFVGKRLVEVIEQYFQDIHVSSDPKTGYFGSSGTSCSTLQQFGPWHDDIDHINPGRTFCKKN